jgi:hypothetical protein
MSRYHGKKGVVYISTTGTGTATLVIGLTAWSIDMTTDKVDVTSFGDANKTYVIGLADCKGSFSGNWDDTEAKLYTASQSSDGCKLYLYPSADAPTKYHYGPAWVDFSMAVDANGAVKVSGTWVANGAWGHNL